MPTYIVDVQQANIPVLLLVGFEDKGGLVSQKMKVPLLFKGKNRLGKCPKQMFEYQGYDTKVTYTILLEKARTNFKKRVCVRETVTGK